MIALPILPAQDAGVAIAVNADVGETIGWPELVGTVAGVYRSAGRTAVIFASNYGEAGAIDRYGPAVGLRQAYSGHNGFAELGAAARSPGSRRRRRLRGTELLAPLRRLPAGGPGRQPCRSRQRRARRPDRALPIHAGAVVCDLEEPPPPRVTGHEARRRAGAPLGLGSPNARSHDRRRKDLSRGAPRPHPRPRRGPRPGPRGRPQRRGHDAAQGPLPRARRLTPGHPGPRAGRRGRRARPRSDPLRNRRSGDGDRRRRRPGRAGGRPRTTADARPPVARVDRRRRRSRGLHDRPRRPLHSSEAGARRTRPDPRGGRRRRHGGRPARRRRRRAGHRDRPQRGDARSARRARRRRLRPRRLRGARAVRRDPRARRRAQPGRERQGARARADGSA